MKKSLVRLAFNPFLQKTAGTLCTRNPGSGTRSATIKHICSNQRPLLMLIRSPIFPVYLSARSLLPKKNVDPKARSIVLARARYTYTVLTLKFPHDLARNSCSIPEFTQKCLRYVKFVLAFFLTYK